MGYFPYGYWQARYYVISNIGGGSNYAGSLMKIFLEEIRNNDDHKKEEILFALIKCLSHIYVITGLSNT